MVLYQRRAVMDLGEGDGKRATRRHVMDGQDGDWEEGWRLHGADLPDKLRHDRLLRAGR